MQIACILPAILHNLSAKRSANSAFCAKRSEGAWVRSGSTKVTKCRLRGSLKTLAFCHSKRSRTGGPPIAMKVRRKGGALAPPANAHDGKRALAPEAVRLQGLKAPPLAGPKAAGLKPRPSAGLSRERCEESRQLQSQRTPEIFRYHEDAGWTPSPGLPRLMKAPAAGHPLPQGGEGHFHSGYCRLEVRCRKAANLADG